jgi:TolA-binding protein
VASNLTSKAAACDQPQLKIAETVALHGSVLEQAGAPDQAVQIYTKNLTEAVPADYRRTAFLRIVELTLAQNRLTDAAQLERFLAQYPREVDSDIALLSLGELYLNQYALAVEASRTNSNFVVPTNYLHDALSRFERLRANFPESPLLGQAHMNRGWCYWEQGNISESQAAFKLATEKLQQPEYLALARFKLADTELRQNDYTNAIANYRQAMRDAVAAPAITDVLSAQALYQITRAMMAMGAFKEAEQSVAKLLQDFSDQPFGQSGLLLVSYGLVRAARPAEARAVLLDFADKVKDSPLKPQAEFAIARSYAEEKQWEPAIRAYTEWIDRYGTNRLRPQVEFDRAWVHYFAKQETNAFQLFTNFVAKYPNEPLAAKAQFWIADFYLRHGNYTDAELHFQSTNLANVYQAKMMAGRAAFARHAYKDAKDYFTALINDNTCPPEVAAEAFFALGDTILLGEGDQSNPIQKFDDAREAFWRIPLLYPTSPLVAQALGQIGNCYLQMATIDAKYYSNALNAYFAVLAPTNGAGVTARSQAEFGIAQVFERQAKGPPERQELLKLALNHHLNVFNGKNLKANEVADPVWARRSGAEAARLAEEQKQWELAINIYLGLRDLAPASRDSLDRKITRLRALVGSEKS